MQGAEIAQSVIDQTADRTVRGSNLAGLRDFSLLQNAQTVSRVQPTTIQWLSVFSPEVKPPRRAVDYSPLPATEVSKDWNCNFPPPRYAFVSGFSVFHHEIVRTMILF